MDETAAAAASREQNLAYSLSHRYWSLCTSWYLKSAFALPLVCASRTPLQMILSHRDRLPHVAATRPLHHPLAPRRSRHQRSTLHQASFVQQIEAALSLFCLQQAPTVAVDLSPEVALRQVGSANLLT